MPARLHPSLMAFVVGISVVRPAWTQPVEDRSAAPEPRPGAAASSVREGLDALEASLDRAVNRVSLPHVARLLGHEAARGYRLPGYGVVLVLPPRSLPGSEDVIYRVGAGRSKLRVRMRQTPRPGAQPSDVESLERQVVVLQTAAEQTRRAAEEDMERIVQEMRTRVAAPEGGPTLSHPQASPPAPEPPPPVDHAGTPLPPPWRFWFETGAPRDERPPQAVIADVRGALVDVLADPPARIAGLKPEEFLAIAVDFEIAGPRLAKPSTERSLVIRARARDLEARARGALAAEELRRRIEVTEY